MTPEELRAMSDDDFEAFVLEALKTVDPKTNRPLVVAIIHEIDRRTRDMGAKGWMDHLLGGTGGD